jgi:hypothetical protein
VVKSARPRDLLQQLVAVLLEASLRRDELLEQSKRLLDAGERTAARRALAAAQELQGMLTKLEERCRRTPTVGNGG